MYHFNIYPASTWVEFFHKATTEKNMSLGEAIEFAKDFGPGQAKEAITKLTT